MTILTNQMPGYTYGDLLTTTNSGQGLTNVLKNLQDGFGNDSTVLIANNAIQFLYGAGNNLYLNNTALTSSGNNINLSTQDNPVFQGTGALTVPIGNTSQRPSIAVNGMMRYNSQISNFEFYENGSWVGSAGVATITGTAHQIVVTGTTNAVISLASDIDGINSLTTTNIGFDLTVGTITTNSAIPLILRPNSNSAVQIGANSSVNNLEIRGGSELRFYSTNGASYTGWKCSISASSNILEMPQTAGNPGDVLTNDGTGVTFWTPASVNEITVFVDQAAHGFSVGDVIRLNGSTYVKAQANNATNSEVVGIVTSLGSVPADLFYYTISGRFSASSVLTPGAVYFLNPATPGQFTAVKPTTSGQVIKPIFIAIDTLRGIWLNQRGDIIP